MIELIAARGNTSLESAVVLTKSLRLDIQSLGQRLAIAAQSEEQGRKGAKTLRDRSRSKELIRFIIQDIKKLLVRIEDAVPLMNLAITTSGAKLSTNLPATISPSRLLQASTFLTAGDTQYFFSPSQAVQIGPTFTLSMYMLFLGHPRPQDEEGVREATWKEVIHKARLKLRRVPMDQAMSPQSQLWSHQLPAEGRVDEFAYQMLVIEDLDDDRVHSYDENEPQPHVYEGVDVAGIRDIIPIHQISKIFYADTSRILNISTDGETNNPVLLLKRDIDAIPPRRMIEREAGLTPADVSDPEEVDGIQAQLDAQLIGVEEVCSNPSFHESSIPKEWRLPENLDPEWIAFEVYNEDEASDTESDTEVHKSPDPEKLAKLSIDDITHPSSPHRASPKPQTEQSQPTTTVTNPLFNNIRTSLSLLETLLRLMSLQQFQQQSHLAISDELLNFFLEESSTTGAGGDEQHRQRLRADARRRVGWDPYDESPVKRRGEDYQHVGDHEEAPGAPIGYVRGASEVPHTPTERARGYHIRSRENTPGNSSYIRWSSSKQNTLRGDSGRRGSPMPREEIPRKGSPFEK
ncbi:RanGTP-binding protein-domain-containing protein [Aspergillus heterothallicus]